MSEAKKGNFFIIIIIIGTLLLGIVLGASLLLLQSTSETVTVQQVEKDTNNPIISTIIPGLLQATVSAPTDAQVWTELGNAYYDTNQPQKAIEAYKKVLELDQATPEVLTDYATMLRANNAFDLALQNYDKALLLNPKHPVAMYNKGLLLYYDLKRPNDAFAIWNTLLVALPDARTPNGRLLKDFMSDLAEQPVAPPLQ